MSQIQQSHTIFNFNTAKNTNLWRIVNDDVMGGKSKSKVYLKENKGFFEGQVSLDNNGGFAMTQFDCKVNDVKDFEKIVLNIKGDDKVYQFRIKENRYNIYSYVQSFKTTGKEETIELYLKDFVPQFRGLKLDMPDFEKNIIEQVAILIGNKKDQKFKLQLNKITLK
jgi:hypothetical protein